LQRYWVYEELVMVLADRLREKSSAIAERWLRDTLATYPGESAAAFQRQTDPFANPVGHAVRAGTRAALDAFLHGEQPHKICFCLDEIIKIRAVQEFSPSRAISFVFLLKDAIRAELAAEDGHGSSCDSELTELEKQIDQIALGAFDIYMRYRAQVCELRINEVKRSVAKLVERLNRRNALPEADEVLMQPAASQHAQAE
jgi:hypothetical protein